MPMDDDLGRGQTSTGYQGQGRGSGVTDARPSPGGGNTGGSGNAGGGGNRDRQNDSGSDSGSGSYAKQTAKENERRQAEANQRAADDARAKATQDAVDRERQKAADDARAKATQDAVDRDKRLAAITEGMRQSELQRVAAEIASLRGVPLPQVQEARVTPDQARFKRDVDLDAAYDAVQAGLTMQGSGAMSPPVAQTTPTTTLTNVPGGSEAPPSGKAPANDYLSKIPYTKSDVNAIAEQLSKVYGIDPRLVKAQLMNESGMNPFPKTGTAGEQGPGQVKPSTFKDPGYGVTPGTGDITNPYTNIDFQIRYLIGRGAKGDVSNLNTDEGIREALEAYNSGSNRSKYASDIMGSMGKEIGPLQRATDTVLGFTRPVTDALINAPGNTLKALNEAFDSIPQTKALEDQNRLAGGLTKQEYADLFADGDLSKVQSRIVDYGQGQQVDYYTKSLGDVFGEAASDLGKGISNAGKGITSLFGGETSTAMQPIVTDPFAPTGFGPYGDLTREEYRKQYGGSDIATNLPPTGASATTPVVPPVVPPVIPPVPPPVAPPVVQQRYTGTPTVATQGFDFSRPFAPRVPINFANLGQAYAPTALSTASAPPLPGIPGAAYATPYQRLG